MLVVTLSDRKRLGSEAEIKHVDEVRREEVGHRCVFHHFRWVTFDAEGDFPLD